MLSYLTYVLSIATYRKYSKSYGDVCHTFCFATFLPSVEYHFWYIVYPLFVYLFLLVETNGP